MMNLCYDTGHVDCWDEQSPKVTLPKLRRVAVRKRIALSLTRLLFVALPCIFLGCKENHRKENYESPEAFIKHWVIEREAKKYCSDERMKELHFKCIEVSNARLSTADGETVVCATLRFVPDSDKTVYAVIPGALPIGSSDFQEKYGLQILPPEKLNEWITADLKMPRIKMDNGIFAPIDMEDGHYIQGWGIVNCLMVVNEENFTEMLRKFLVEVKALKNNKAEKTNNGAMVIMRLASYASSGELDFIKDKKLLEELGDACTWILSMTAKETDRKQFVRIFGEKTLNSIASLTEILRARGIKMSGPNDYRNRALCIVNMKNILEAVVAYYMKHRKSPSTIADLADEELLEAIPTCPKDNSAYVISGEGTKMKVTCGSGDPTHVLP